MLVCVFLYLGGVDVGLNLQTVVQIRVVLAFVGESRALQAYSSSLRTAQKIGYRTGFAKGMGIGGHLLCCFLLLCSFALVWWLFG